MSLTIPMTSVGPPGTGTGEIQQAIAAGARIDVFGIEDFDYGLTSGTQVSSDETVASDVAGQLESLYGWSAATAWSHIGIRDQACPAGVQEPWAPGTCGNISENPYDFTKIVAQYSG